MSAPASILVSRPVIGGRTSDSRSRARVSSWRFRRDFEEVRSFVLFVGCPRSGHSLLGSLLDAHPDAVIAHELDALRYVVDGWTRGELYARILLHDREFTAAGREWFGYDYTVPGQWQGRFRRLRVIGDKRGGLTTQRLAGDPRLLDRLQDVVGVPLRILHVTRNPFDNIVTMARRAGETLDQAADRYLELCDAVASIHSRRSNDIVDVRHEDLVADVPGRLGAICSWIGLEPDADYLAACSAVTFDRPRHTRGELAWSASLTDRIRTAVGQYEFLRGYALDDVP
jgi:sulfotransferase family protein